MKLKLLIAALFTLSSHAASTGQTAVTGSGKTQEEARAAAENTIASRRYTSHRVTNTKFSKDSSKYICTISFTYERK